MKIPIQFMEDKPFEVFLARRRFLAEHRTGHHEFNGGAMALPRVRAPAPLLTADKRISLAGLKRIWEKGST